MKIAVFSDIHSNVFALEAVLEDIWKKKADKLVNLGDIFYGPIAPGGTYRLLQECEVLTILGNQDRLICEAAADELKKNDTLRFVKEELGNEGLCWISSLPESADIDGEVFCCHGSPASDTEYLLEDVSSGAPRMRPEPEILSRLAGKTYQLILCGHSHLPRSVSLADGRLIVNPGSVGLPSYADDMPCYHVMENFSHHASYAVLERKKRGEWDINQLKVAYDYRAAAQAAKERMRDDWAYFLETGRAVEPGGR